jgi:hypothetical protein
MESCVWQEEYERCPFFGAPRESVHGGADDWPEGYQYVKDRLYLNGKSCIPYTLQHAHIRAYHDFLLHCGPERLWKKLLLLYEFADWGQAKDYTEK